MEDFNFKKSFGQNFINDKNVIYKIIDCSDIKENSLVIEIGPGSGNLTKELSKVKWPERKEVLKYTLSTIIFILIVVGFFVLLTMGMSWVIKMVNGA